MQYLRLCGCCQRLFATTVTNAQFRWSSHKTARRSRVTLVPGRRRGLGNPFLAYDLGDGRRSEADPDRGLAGQKKNTHAYVSGFDATLVGHRGQSIEGSRRRVRTGRTRPRRPCGEVLADVREEACRRRGRHEELCRFFDDRHLREELLDREGRWRASAFSASVPARACASVVLVRSCRATNPAGRSPDARRALLPSRARPFNRRTPMPSPIRSPERATPQ